MPTVFFGERPYSGSVGHILLGDARIGGASESQKGGACARIMMAFYSDPMVDQPAILDRIGAYRLWFCVLGEDMWPEGEKMRVWEGENSKEDADSCFSLATCRCAV